MGLGERGARLLSEDAGLLDQLGHEVVALGVSQGDVHAKAGEQHDERLRAGEGLAVGRAIGPGDGDLLALEVVKATKLVDEVEQVGRRLRGVVGVGLQRDERGTVVEDAVGVGLRHGLRDLLHVRVALADELVVTDADDISHEADHRGGLAHGLAVGDLRLGLVEVLELQAQHVGARGKREARTGGVVAEVGDRKAGVEDARGDVALAQVAKGVGDQVKSAELVGGLIPRVQEVVVVHLGVVELLELVEVVLEYGVHSFPFL